MRWSFYYLMPFFLGTNTFLRERYLSLSMHSDLYLQYACTCYGPRLIWDFLSIDSNERKWIPSMAQNYSQVLAKTMHGHKEVWFGSNIPTIMVLHLLIKLLIRFSQEAMNLIDLWWPWVIHVFCRMAINCWNYHHWNVLIKPNETDFITRLSLLLPFALISSV